MNARDVLLSVPTRGTIQWATVTRLEEIRDSNPGMAPILYQQGNLSVAQTRNRIVKLFLAGPWQALAMVDDDVVPPPFLLQLRDQLEEFGIVGVPHPMPHPGDAAELVLTAFEETADGGLTAATIREGIHECDALATGAVLISRTLLETLGPAPFRIDADPDAAITSDDFLFCADARAAGFRVAYAYCGGWFSDHHTTTALAPLMEAALSDRRYSHVS